MELFFGGTVEIFVLLVFILVIGIFIFTFIRGFIRWNKNNHSLILTVEARIVAKRAHTSHHGGTDTMPASGTTVYYVTFQVESGGRMELRVDGQEYGLLAEGDFGKLTFQGTRYLGFERM